MRVCCRAFCKMVLPGILWIEGSVSAKEKNCRSEVLKFSVPSSDRFDLLDLSIDSLGSGVGLFMAKCTAHACEMSFKPLCDLQDLIHGRFFRAGSNHRWYRKTFPDYPTNRRALIPGIY